MIGEGPYRSRLVISLDEEETLWQMLDEALGLSLRDPRKSYELALFVWEESHNRSTELITAVVELLSVLWGTRDVLGGDD